EVDATARAIELVAEEYIGRAGCDAESAMHASAQDLVGDRNIGVGELREGEVGLHTQTPAYIRPGFSTRFGSKLSLMRRVSAATAGSSGSKTTAPARTAALARIKVAWPPPSSASRIAFSCGASPGIAAQISPPAQS